MSFMLQGFAALFLCRMNRDGSNGPEGSRPSRKPGCTFRNLNTIASATEDFRDFGRDLCGVFRSITVTYPKALRESERIRYAESRRPRRSIPKREVATRPGTDRRAVDLARRLGGRK